MKKMTIRRNALIILVTIGVIFDLFISGILFYQTHRAEQNSSAIRVAKIAAYQTCLRGNDFRAADLTRWNEVLLLINTMPKNTTLQRFIASVQVANKIADAPEKCVAP